MGSSDDWWRHNSPWPGHDAQGPGHAPGEPRGGWTGPPIIDPGPYVPPPSYGGAVGGYGGYTGASGMGVDSQAGTGCGVFLGFALFFGLVPKALAIIPILYPFVAAIEVGVMRAAVSLVERFDAGDTTVRQLAIAAVAPIALLWPLSRVEQRLENFRAYVIVRHVARLALVALVTWQVTRDLPASTPFPVSLHPVQKLFRSPAQLGATAGAVLLMHLLLFKAKGAQRAWRGLLELTRLRRA